MLREKCGNHVAFPRGFFNSPFGSISQPLMSTRWQISRWRWLLAAALLIGLGLAAVFLKGTQTALRRGTTKKTDAPLETGVQVSDEFLAAMIEGRSAFENVDGPRAIAAFEKAVALEPSQADAHLNLANAYLLADQAERAIAHAQEVLRLAKNSAAALYIAGCAHLRRGIADEALKALQQSRFIEPDVAAVHFHIGRAHQALSQWEEAIAAFRETTAREPEHAAAHYAMSQVFIRTGQTAEAQEAIEQHKRIVAKRPPPSDPTFFEKSVHTRARLPEVRPEQPDPAGVPVRFADVTEATLAGLSGQAPAAVGVIDLKHDGRNSILAAGGEGGVRLLVNGGAAKFQQGATAGDAGVVRRVLVGDLDNDGVEDVILLGERGTRVFRVTAEGEFVDMTEASGLGAVAALDGLLSDLDFTGKLGLITAGEKGVSIFRNRGKFVFEEGTQAFGLGDQPPASSVAVDDWNGDNSPDLFVAPQTGPVQLWLNQHGGTLRVARPDAPRLNPTTPMQPSGEPAAGSADAPEWPAGKALAVGDLNCDMRVDVIVATSEGFAIVFGGMKERAAISATEVAKAQLTLLDYDNDGWLDVAAIAGGRLRIWRNLGRSGFSEVTDALGIAAEGVTHLAHADFQGDGDTDLVVGAGTGLRLLQNDGGNANRQLKVSAPGRRSNASGIGTRLELVTPQWRTTRTIRTLPVEIGIGKHAKIDSFGAHWPDVVMNFGAIEVGHGTSLEMIEAELPAGSCPYLYVWDGEQFRFVTDLLGASPLGLPLSDTRYIDADPDELVHIGSEENVKPRDGNYVLQITEELRELLFLDQAQLVVVDHGPEAEVHSTSKLLPGKPFLPHELVALSSRKPLLHALRSDERDVTAELQEIDGKKVSPVQLRGPQLRGLAEPYSITLDFGPLPAERPLVLSLNGWLRFGGGMANIGGSRDPSLPFPFPTLEVETESGAWQPVDAVVGAPAGKTKSIIVDLTGKLPAGAKRLRMSMAFELHWDRIALFERNSARSFRSTRLDPAVADLHWRGSAEYADLPWFHPLTPVYDQLRSAAPWLVVPAGWCTRYGDVTELIAQKDNALAVMNYGDELTLTFPEAALPPKEPGTVRQFFLFTSGWDKDSDYHVAAGLTVEPLPWHGLDDQQYGRQPRPAFPDDSWIQRYNTRWVGPLTLRPSRGSSGPAPPTSR
jgi:tetratricopeptide (TPR) repeat protein